MKLVLVVTLTLATLILAVPHKRERQERGDIGQPEVEPEPQILPDPDGDDDGGRQERGDIGEPEIEPEPEILPNPEGDDGEDDRDKREYRYYSSSPSSPQPPTKPAKPTKPTNVIDHKAEGGTGKAGGCRDEFDASSTMCVSKDDPTVTEYGFSPADMKNIVAFHNEIRAKVKAKNMVKMYWDDKMAEIAQKRAQSCEKGHDSNEARKVPGYGFSIGQNWGGGMPLAKCLELWYNEYKKFKYNDPAANKGQMIGHYTQMINHKAIGIGCGYAYCSFRHNIICNYAFGQTGGQVNKPYTKGSKGALCAKGTKDNTQLCDFGKAKYCLNGGKLNISTGECKCMKPYHGADCSEIKCFPDKSICNTGKYVASNCKKYTNLVEFCPAMCGAC